MLDRKSIPILMIVIKDHDTSELYASHCIQSWERWGYKVTRVDACTPETLADQADILPFRPRSKSGVKRYHTNTEKATFYSHYNCWRTVLDSYPKGAIVMEHDCYSYRPLPMNHSDMWSTPYQPICSFEGSSWIMASRPAPSAGYFLSRVGAAQTINWVKNRAKSRQGLTHNNDMYQHQMWYRNWYKEQHGTYPSNTDLKDPIGNQAWFDAGQKYLCASQLQGFGNTIHHESWED